MRADCLPKLTAFEEFWQQGDAHSSFHTVGQQIYNPGDLMSHFEKTYKQLPTKVERIQQTLQQWTPLAFEDTVEGSLTSGAVPSGTPNTFLRPEYSPGSEDILEEYVSQSLAAVRLTARKLPSHASAGQITEEIKRLFQSRALGTPDNVETVRAGNDSDLQQKVERAMNNRSPLQFVLPAFPSKVQNPFRCNVPQDHVDLGDVALLVRLGMIAFAISQIYPFGAEWIITSDGTAYAPMFDEDQEQARLYIERLRAFRNRLKFQEVIHFIDLVELIERSSQVRIPKEGANSTELATFDSIHQQIMEIIVTLKTRDKYAALKRGMRQNINTQNLLQGDLFTPDSNRADLWAALYGNAADNPLTEIVEQRSERAALEYFSHRLATTYARLFPTMLPDAIRATVHKNPGRLLIARLGDSYSWTATAYVSRGKQGNIVIESKPLHKIIQSPTRAVHLHGGASPFYYQKI